MAGGAHIAGRGFGGPRVAQGGWGQRGWGGGYYGGLSGLYAFAPYDYGYDTGYCGGYPYYNTYASCYAYGW
jgi:hypothetical protein